MLFVKYLSFFIALFFGKAVRILLKILPEKGATALPGLLALKIDPSFLERATYNLENIVISGTNGKTTTARILATILKKEGRAFIHNRHGSNLKRGIASAIIASSLQEINEKEVGLWETDEGALPEIIKKINPGIVLLLNLFRDQLDRYGEIEQICQKWLKALQGLSSKTKIILNSDDPFLSFIGQKLTGKKIYWYGLNTTGISKPEEARDINFCPLCGERLSYTKFFMAHLGDFICKKCGFKRSKLDFSCQKILKSDLKSSCFVVHDLKKNYKINARLPGIYNLYNLLAAFSLASVLGIEKETIVEAIETFKPAFGRVEEILIGDKIVTILLVKNPTGFNQVLKLLKSKRDLNLLISINDLIADGQDVSWIWDINFSQIKNRVNKFIVSGIRAEDMALRLKYAGFNNFTIVKNLDNAVQAFVSCPKNRYFLPTYTSMLEIRNYLNKKNYIHRSWDD